MAFERSFFKVIGAVFVCLTLSYMLTMMRGSYDYRPTTGNDDANGFCLHGSICKRKSGSMFFEYRRERNFEKRLRLEPKDLTQSVPNIIHFTWFKGKKSFFRFHQLLSVMAVQRAMDPAVYFWFDVMPFGENWDKLTKLLPKIHFVHRNDTKTNTHEFIEDLESRVRYEALLEFGGIAVEFDTFIIKSLDAFFDFETTFGIYPSLDLASDVIISKPWSTILRKWYLIQTDSLTRHGTPFETLTELVYIERQGVRLESGLVAPDSANMAYLYKEGLYSDWRKEFWWCVKLWTEKHDTEHNREDIKTWNTTLGDIFRYIYFAQQEHIHKPENKVLF